MNEFNEIDTQKQVVDWLITRAVDKSDSSKSWTLVIGAPFKMTALQAGDNYTKLAMRGGERMGLIGAYVGKRNGVILQFDPLNFGKNGPDPVNDVMAMEISLSELNKRMPGISIRDETVGELLLWANGGAAPKVKDATITIEAASERYSDNPYWGTW